MILLSIIVPVYNVEQYIRPCLQSLLGQELDENSYEVILVNDGTRDNSLGVVADLIAQHPNITVLEQPNQGLSVARNTGLARAKGEYVMFVDSDDLLTPHSVAPLLQLVHQTQADLLMADFVKLNDRQIDSYQPELQEGELSVEQKTGSELFLTDHAPNQCYVWRTIYRRQFLSQNGLQFIPGIYFEDTPFTTECFLKARHCLRVRQPLYIYRQRQGSICSDITKEKVMDFNKVLAHLWQMRQDVSLTAAEQHQLMQTIFTTFSIEFWYIAHHQNVFAARQEILKDLRQRIPDLHFTGGLKQRLVSFCYRLMPDTYIRMRRL